MLDKIAISPDRNHPELTEVKNRLRREIEELQKEYERNQRKLEASEIKEGKLIERKATA